MVDVASRIEPRFLGDEHVPAATRTFRPAKAFGGESPRSITARGLDDHFRPPRRTPNPVVENLNAVYGVTATAA
jgi:hypothetical protein